jgi:indole-3-glycerol phosphate synthase
MSILKKIVENTRENLKAKKAKLSLEDVKSSLKELDLPKSNFKSSISNKDEAIIAEIKKASPSAGVISENFNPVEKAKEYESVGAAALSILTEEDFFLGSIDYLKAVKRTTSLPILRKDFIIDEYQIYESKLIGADCILLIASILSDLQIEEFVKIAKKLELDYLIEIHDEKELKRVELYKDALIGVNNRNLNTFEVDLDNSIRIKNLFKEKNIFIAESGIKSIDDINYLKLYNINVFLIGESLMRGDFFKK